MAKWNRYKGATRRKGQMKRFSAAMVSTGSNTDTPRARIMADRKVDGEALGATVLYRDHVKSQGHVNPGSLRIKQPQALVQNTKYDVDRYRTLPDDRVPPVIAAMRRRQKEWQANTGPGRLSGTIKYNHFVVKDEVYFKLLCCFSGDKAFFVEVDGLRHTIRESIEYRYTRARRMVDEAMHHQISWIRKMNAPDCDTS